jgi:hypothetical protein
VPAISSFYGLTIKMFYRLSEHNPPHFHAVYGEYVGSFNIQNGEMIEGDLPDKGQRLVREWHGLHKTELLDMWNTQEFRKLPPLL